MDANETERDKWLHVYTLACHEGDYELMNKLPNIQKIRNFLKGDYSKEKIRDYFFLVHNPETFEFMEKNLDFKMSESVHLAIPYQIGEVLGDSLACRLREPFYEIPGFIPASIFSKKITEDAILYDVFNDLPKPGEIIVTHGEYIVDLVPEQDIKKYDYLYEKGKKKKRK
jgi:hypothetical protein